MKVDEKTVKKSGAVKAETRISYASAHDLRRAFGTRWARQVPPMVLKELMRHESVTTTEKFYVDIDADATAAMLAAIMQRGEDTVPDVEADRVIQKNEDSTPGY